MNNLRTSTIRALAAYFILAFGFSWLFWLLAVLTSSGALTLPIPQFAWVVAGAHGPLFAAVWLTQRAAGWGGAWRLLRSGFNLRMGWVWWLAILILPQLLSAAAVVSARWLSQYQPDLSLWSQPWMILPTFLAMLFVGGSVQEEYGWRGYALPRLLTLVNPLAASLALGLTWGVWHLPLFFVSGLSQSYMPFGVFVLLALGFSVLFTWFYLRTDRSLWSALLLHAAINTSLNLFPTLEMKPAGNQTAFTLLMVVYIAISVIIMVKDSTFRPLAPTASFSPFQEGS